jgi:hypothetical protein
MNEATEGGARIRLISTCAVCLYLLTVGCATPGSDRQGRNLIATGNRIVAALEAHRSATGAYPVSLVELSGAFDLGRPGSDHEFLYRPATDTFQLTLNYSPSWPNTGRVTCGFEAATQEWRCGGYL